MVCLGFYLDPLSIKALSTSGMSSDFHLDARSAPLFAFFDATHSASYKRDILFPYLPRSILSSTAFSPSFRLTQDDDYIIIITIIFNITNAIKLDLCTIRRRRDDLLSSVDPSERNAELYFDV